VPNQKFELTNQTYNHFGIWLHRIRALRDFGDVKAGSLGGWVEKSSNLSQEGNCWIYDVSMVYQEAAILDAAQVRGACWIHNAARLRDNAIAKDSCVIQDNADCFEDCVINGTAFISGSAQIYGNCSVADRAGVYGKARCHGHSKIYQDGHVFGIIELTGRVKVRGTAKLFEGFYDSGCYDAWSPFTVNAGLHG
jgi:NDP-sugar pyrophosphorylase family protein